MRKSKQRADALFVERTQSSKQCVCPLCNRNIPDGQKDEHHLIPRSKKGTQTAALHRACHRQIHMLFSNSELAGHYNSAEALLEHPEIQKFVRWIATKPNDFLPQFHPSKHNR